MSARVWLPLLAQLGFFAALNFFDDWTLEMMPVKFVVCAIASGLCYLLAATEFASSRRASLGLFWVTTIVLRLVALPLAPASEVWRYQADGAIQRIGFDPYLLPPNHPHLAAAVPEPGRIPRNDEPTVFAPGAEILFRIIPANDDPLAYKVVFGLADILSLVLLLGCVDRRTAVWYAWNPLLAYSFAGAAHFDGIVLLALSGLILSLERFSAAQRRRWLFATLAAVCLGVAVALRPVTIVLLLPCALCLRRYFGLLGFAAAIPLAACWALHVSPLPNLFGDFNHVTRLNDLFWWLIEDTVLPNWHEQYYRYDIVILAVATVLALVFARNWRRALIWALGSSIVLAPVLHPWYVAWVLPLATWRRAWAWHFLAVTIFAYYLFFNERLFALPWHAEPWMRGIILVPVLFALLILTLQKLPRRDAV